MEFTSGKNLINIENIKFKKNIILITENISWNIDATVIKLYKDDFNLEKYKNNIININFWYELKQDNFLYNFYNSESIIIPNEYFKNIFPQDLHQKLIILNTLNNLPKYITQYKISEKIKHIEAIFKNKYNLIELHNKKTPCFFFGLYNSTDYNNIINHIGEKHIIFGGSDLDVNMAHTKKLIPMLKEIIDKNNNKNNIKIYFISENLRSRGLELGLEGSLVNLNLVNEKWTNNIDNIKKSNIVYFYNGCNKIGKLYNNEKLLEIENKLKQYDIKCIYSSELNCKNDDMINIYKKCFIGVRLTKKDGNANTVLELEKLNIPVIFNGNNVNAISYVVDDIEDVVNKILYWKKMLLDLEDYD